MAWKQLIREPLLKELLDLGSSRDNLSSDLYDESSNDQTEDTFKIDGDIRSFCEIIA